MKIIAWDIGIKNLAFCLLSKEFSGDTNWKILNLSVIDLETKTKVKTNLVKKLYEKLQQYPILDVDKVIIESQPGKRADMDCIQAALIMYYIMNNKQVKCKRTPLIGAEIVPSGKKNYRLRKKMSVELMHKHINESQCQENKNILQVIKNNSKLDDMSDAFLLALSEIIV